MDYSSLIAKRRERFSELEDAVGDPDLFSDPKRATDILREHPHYRIFGAFTAGRLAAVAGVWIATKIWCGRYLEIERLRLSTMVDLDNGRATTAVEDA